MARIETYDTTLRDGAQSTSISLTLEDKLRIVERLDAFGIDIIEGGFPASNPKDIAFFQRVTQLPLAHSRIAAFGSTCRKGVAAAEDEGLAQLVACGAPVVTLVGKASALHVREVLQADLSENLRMIGESVAFVREAGREVIFDAEHFFDGYRDDPVFAIDCLLAAANAGARTIVLCDTNGGTLPSQIALVTDEVVDALAGFAAATGLTVGIHCHDDAGLAVANTLSAVEAGARQVQGTVNGYGERVGNADLLTVIANLELKMGHECVGAEALRAMTSVSRFVAHACNHSLPHHHPYTGSAAFVHKGGLHGAAEVRLNSAYEHTDPAAVGNESQMVVSEFAGRATLMAKAKELGFDLSDRPDAVRDILEDVKQREAAGYSYEAADGSLAVLILRHIGEYRPFFDLESFRVIVDDYEDRGAQAAGAMSEATIKIHVGDERHVATGEGTGPVGALDSALRLALERFYPQVAGMELSDYKVHILDESVGTGSVTRVSITTSDASGTWSTIGVSENILEASWNALVDSIEYGLYRFFRFGSH